MGKKNKFNKSDEPGDNKDSQQSQNPKPGDGNKTVQQQGGGQSKQQQNPQQDPRGGGQPKQQQNPQQFASGGGQPRQQQGGSGGGQTKQHQNQQQGAQGGGHPRQQQGAWGGGQQQPSDNKRQQKGGGDQQQRRDAQQHGGGGFAQQFRNPGGDQQQNRGVGQQGGGWNQQQRSSRPDDGSQQRGWNQGRGNQQGGGQQRSSRPDDGNQQRGSNQGRGFQQGGGQQRSARPDDGNQQRGSNQGIGYQQGGGQQRSARPDDGNQQRGSNQGSGYQQGGGQQQYGRSQQQKPQSGYSQDQQVRGQQHAKPSSSSETPLPVKDKSCNGLVRGTLGIPGTVEVNYLRLNLDKMPDEAYHYDITITPDRPKKFLRPAFEQFRLEVFPNALLTFDGLKNCYSLQRLNTPIERTINVPDSGNRTKEFKVLIKETDTCVVDLKSLRTYHAERIFDKPMRALQVLEVVLASSNHERGVRVGRSFFRRPLDAFYLEDGYEAWTGLYQAAILGEMPLLNVDIAHKSFPCESTLIEYLNNMKVDTNNSLDSSYSFRDISSFLKGINVVYTPPTCFGAPAKQYKVLGVGEPASKKSFKTDDGKQFTVQSYFRSRGYTLKYPNLNCLTAGSTVKQISLPMELCSIPAGQALNRKDQSRQVEKMIRYAATSTNRRKQKIMELLTYFDHNINPVIRGFGLSIGSDFLKVPMRLLPPPTLEYLQGRTVRAMKGVWRMDENKFLICSKPPNGHKWAILYEEVTRGRGTSYHDLENFRNAVAKTSQTLNMNLQNNAEIIPYKYNQLQTVLKELARDKYDLVFVVLNERGTSYAKVKQTAELEVGILTQCIKDKTVFRTARDRTVFSNILLKVNGKLNGTNHKIAQDRDANLLSPVKNVMYLGADVTHPSPDQREIPSVVGVAASHDQYGACYNCQYRLQRSTVENIEDMESIFTRHLEMYNKYQKRYPDQIIYYRDGVSDGQFPIVEREEIRAIKRACAKMRCNPKMTCVIVVKRHHTRFFPMKQPDHDRDFNNVQAGTVVDQYITHPNEVQFFMVSHQSIQGTARPTRYNVIMDESKFDINMLQKLTYNLCHLFPRCNRSVSYPAPAYLAHLVAFRGRVYLEGTQRFDSNLKREYDKRLIKPDFLNKNPMYFI